MKTMLYAILLLSAVLSWRSYGQSTSPASIETLEHQPLKSFPTESAVSNVVKVGVSRQVVTNAFGEPSSHVTTPDGTVVEFYDVDLGNRAVEWENKYSGFEIFYKYGRVSAWAPTYSSRYISGVNDQPVTDTNLLNPPGSKPNSTNSAAEIEFSVVNDTPLSGTVYMDTPRFPNLGYVPVKPDLKVRRLQSVELMIDKKANGNEEKAYEVAITLLSKDAETFSKITAQNIARRMLLSVDRNPVRAPRIISPIKNAAMVITDLSQKEAESLTASLRGMIDQPDAQ